MRKVGGRGGSRGGYTNDIPHPGGCFYNIFRLDCVRFFAFLSKGHLTPLTPGGGWGGTPLAVGAGSRAITIQRVYVPSNSVT